jgi:hypothetical protein
LQCSTAALALGSLLATPYVLDYGLVALAVAIAFFARHSLNNGFRDFEISLLAAAWIVSLLSRSIAGVSYIPLRLLVVRWSCGAPPSTVRAMRSAEPASRKRDLCCSGVLGESFCARAVR